MLSKVDDDAVIISRTKKFYQNHYFAFYFLFKSKLVPGLTLADLAPTDALNFDAFSLFSSIFNFFAGTINSSLDKFKLLFLPTLISFSFSNLVSDRVPRVSFESEFRFDKYVELSVFSSSFPTSSSMLFV